MMKEILAMTAIFLGAIFAVPRLAGADVEGVPCIPEPTDQTIGYGNLITCEISPVGDTDVFRFSGSAGEVAIIQVTRQGGGSPCVELFRPDGTALASNCTFGSSARVGAALDQTGTYSILVTEHVNDSTMAYALSLERVAPPSPSAKPICPGCLLNGEINPVGDVDLFAFQGETGDTVTVQVTRQGGGSPCVELARPDGTLLASNCTFGSSARVDAILDQNGTHTIVITENVNDATMPYSLSYQCIGSCPGLPQPPVAGCIELKGEPVSGTTVQLSQLGERKQSTKTDSDGCYEFPSVVSGKKFKVIIKGPTVP